MWSDYTQDIVVLYISYSSIAMIKAMYRRKSLFGFTAAGGCESTMAGSVDKSCRHGGWRKMLRVHSLNHKHKAGRTNWKQHLSLYSKPKTRGMSLCLRVLVLAEDRGQVASTHMLDQLQRTPCPLLTQVSNPRHTYGALTYMQAKHSYT